MLCYIILYIVIMVYYIDMFNYFITLHISILIQTNTKYHILIISYIILVYIVMVDSIIFTCTTLNHTTMYFT